MQLRESSKKLGVTFIVEWTRDIYKMVLSALSEEKGGAVLKQKYQLKDAIELAPADDLFVKTGFSLHIDPLLLPSIMSKKKAVGATHLAVDIPTGRGAKMKTTGEADLLARDIIELGIRLGILSFLMRKGNLTHS
ncbi:MAG: hypothetical protein OEM28_02105 [Nitrosopumilus sp.]|nr:hypothetical protein [Nitrosopumilus sp.]MDH3487367.1 hypothetical protein [Nitrosopumilus sp.]